MTLKYPGLVQIVRRRWLINKIEHIMGSNATVKQFKDFLKQVSQILLAQERHRMLKLQNNLYEKMHYYLDKRAATTGDKMYRSRNQYKNIERPKTEGAINNKINRFFASPKQKPKEDKPDPRFMKSVFKNSRNGSKILQTPNPKDVCKPKKPHQKAPLSKEFYWDSEIDKLRELAKDGTAYSAFKYATPRDLTDKNHGFTSKSINSIESNDFTGSQNSKIPKTSRQKTELIKEQYEAFKNFVDKNTQEELVSARNFLFGIDPRKTIGYPSTAELNVARPTLASNQKLRIKTAAVSQKRFKIVYPSELKLQKEKSAVDDLRKVFSLSPKNSARNQTEKKSSPNKKDKKQASPPKTHQEYGLVDEYKEDQKRKQDLMEKLKASKRNYTFKYK